MVPINIMALDREFNLVALLNYSNLQWSRKYHESGTFSIRISPEQYDSSFKYIYTNERPETGKIVQVNYVQNDNQSYIQLSGYFLENELNRMVVYTPGEGNIVDGPEWLGKIGPAEDVAFDYFNAFSQIKFNVDNATTTFNLGIASGTNTHRGVQAQHYRDNSYLGSKIYHILKPSGMTYRVRYDFEENKQYFEVWSGLNRTSEQMVNNPIVFSTQYYNLKNPNVLLDNSTYKSGCIVTVNKNENDEASVAYTRALLDLDQLHEDNAFLSLQSSLSVDDFDNSNDYYQALDNEGRLEKNTKWLRTMNIEFDASAGSYEYMQDFDIGDVCDLEIYEIGISAEARLIGCYEVIKDNDWSLTLEFGTPIIKR